MRGRGRHGRGRHAGGKPHAYAPPTAAAAPGSSAAADADDDELALFKREAAQIMQKAPPVQLLPGGLNVCTLASAVKQLMNAVGLSKEDAEEALLAVFEEHGNNYEIWIEEAQMWLAVRQESDIEAYKMKEAMEQSLREQAEQRAADQAAAPPLTNLSEDRLRRKFAGSALLPCLTSVLPGNVLFSDAKPLRELIKFKLVQLLSLESNCAKWYPDAGTHAYFAAFGAHCVAQLTSTRCSCSQLKADVSQPAPQLQGQLQDIKQLPIQQQLRSPSPRRQPEQQCSAAGQNAVQECRHSPATASDSSRCARSCSPSASPSIATAAAGAAPPAELSEAAHGCNQPVCGLKRSSRKRQIPSRYRSASPGVDETAYGANKVLRKRISTPEADNSTAAPAAEGTAAVKVARVAGATDVADSRACTGSSIGAMLPPRARKSPIMDSSRVAAETEVGRGSSATPPAQAQEQQWQQDMLAQLSPMLQLSQEHEQRFADLCSALGQHPAVVSRLSQLLVEEHTQVQTAIYAMPETAGAVPSIFKGTADAAGADDGSDSDVEIAAETSAAEAAAKVKGLRPAASDDRRGSAAVGAADAVAASDAAVFGVCATATADQPDPNIMACGVQHSSSSGRQEHQLHNTVQACYAQQAAQQPAAVQQMWQQQAALQRYAAQQHLPDDDDDDVIIIDD